MNGVFSGLLSLRGGYEVVSLGSKDSKWGVGLLSFLQTGNVVDGQHYDFDIGHF